MKEEDDDDNDKDTDAEDKDEDEGGDGDGIADNLMNCLIQNKHHPQMNDKCRIGVEHHQLVSSSFTLDSRRLSLPVTISCTLMYTDWNKNPSCH